MPLAFRQWDGYSPPPNKEFPNQWHVEAGTPEKRAEMRMFTILVPYRAGEAAGLQAERVETADTLGVRVTLGDTTTRVSFPKSASAPLAVVVTSGN